MREFNTSGPNNPDIHFTVMREALTQKALDQIERPKDPKGGRYFTLYAPRQTGKTTFVEQLTNRLDREHFFPVVLSFEALAGLEEPVFYREFGKLFERMSDLPIAIPELHNKLDFMDFLSGLKTRLPQKLCLIIDEFDGIRVSYLGDVLHTFRLIYHARGKKAFAHARKRKDGRRVEAAYHYSLDAFLTAAMENLGGQCHVENSPPATATATAKPTFFCFTTIENIFWRSKTSAGWIS